MEAEHFEVIIVGAGQAGLALSHELSGSGIQHLVLDRGRVAETWRHRHDGFCLVTPNWSVRLPGRPYTGPDPDGFMSRSEIVSWLEDYAGSFDSPIRHGVLVTQIDPLSEGGFHLQARAEEFTCRLLTLATGTFQRPQRLAAVERLPPSIPRMDADAYRSEDTLPPGKVLIVGSGQSGVQIAEELRQAGREVVLACGRAPWLPRRLGGKDIFWWLDQAGFFDQTLESLTTPFERLSPNPTATGRRGGYDLHLRTLEARGVVLTGHFLGVENGFARFARDLPVSAAWGDQRHCELMDLIVTFAKKRGLVPPAVDCPDPIIDLGPERLAMSDFGMIIVAGGFRPGYRYWLPVPEAFDDLGFPLQRDGVSTVIPGLYFVGVHFQRTRKSSLLYGVGEDATVVAERIREHLGKA